MSPVTYIIQFKMEFKFRDKKVIITGAGKGLGRAIAVELAKRNAQVIALSRTQKDLDRLKEENPSIEIYCVDISEWEKIENVLATIGPVDLLVNNAGIVYHVSALDMTKEQIDSIIDINFKAAFHVSQVVARQMVAHKKSGAIVNISSIGSKRAFDLHSVYCCSKAALDMATKTLALELAKFKIRVNSVNPGSVLTDMGKKSMSDPKAMEYAISKIPLGRLAEEEDVVNTVLYLLSDKSAMITGVCIPVDGGHIVKCM